MDVRQWRKRDGATATPADGAYTCLSSCVVGHASRTLSLVISQVQAEDHAPRTYYGDVSTQCASCSCDVWSCFVASNTTLHVSVLICMSALCESPQQTRISSRCTSCQDDPGLQEFCCCVGHPGPWPLHEMTLFVMMSRRVPLRFQAGCGNCMRWYPPNSAMRCFQLFLTSPDSFSCASLSVHRRQTKSSSSHPP